MDYKTRKLIQIVKEWEGNNLDTFEINGVEKDRAIYFYREVNKKFIPLPKGSYQVVDQNGGTFLKITNAEIQAKAIEYQLCYEDVQISKKYEETYPELGILVTKYNDVILDIRNIISYLKSVGMKSDTLQMSQVMAKLQRNTFWYMNEKEELDAFPIGDLNDKYNSMLERIKSESESRIREVHESLKNDLETWKQAFNVHVSEARKTIDGQKQSIVESLDVLYKSLYNSLDRFTDAEKQSLREETDVQISKIRESIDRFISEHAEELRGRGITSITATADKITIQYQDGKQAVFTIPTIPGKDGVAGANGKDAKEIEIMVIEEDLLKLKMKDKTEKSVALESWRLYAKMIGNELNSTDLNDIKEVGWYYSTFYNDIERSNRFSNRPNRANSFILRVESLSLEDPGMHLVQTLNNFETNEVFRRIAVGAQWQSWQKISADLSKYFTVESALALDNKKFDKAGGTVSGMTTFQDSIIMKGTDKKMIAPFNTGYSLHDKDGVSRFFAYIGGDGQICLGHTPEGLDIDVKTRITVKGQEIYHTGNFIKKIWTGEIFTARDICLLPADWQVAFIHFRDDSVPIDAVKTEIIFRSNDNWVQLARGAKITVAGDRRTLYFKGETTDAVVCKAVYVI